MPVFGPPIPDAATFPRGKQFAEFLLAKLINAETAAHRSAKFSTMATRTRQEYLKDLAANYVSTTILETTQKFCKSETVSLCLVLNKMGASSYNNNTSYNFVETKQRIEVITVYNHLF